VGENAAGLKFGKFFGGCLDASGIVTSESILNPKVLGDRPTRLFKTFFESLDAGPSFRIVRQPHQHPDGMRVSLLRMGRNRPTC
jgi:hypothetical protein